MSYQSYMENEFKLVSGYDDVKEYVIQLLDVISEEGHSGGSMGVFSGVFKEWSKDPRELKDNSLFSPIWKIVKDIPYGLVPKTLETVSKLMTFTPLSHLTGEDDEWITHDYGDDCYKQNRRMSNVFQNKDGLSYNIDGRIFYEPTDVFNFFIGYTNGVSGRVYINFPYDPETEPERIYYTDESRTQVVTGDPESWLKEQRTKLFLGSNPLTGKINKDSHFVSFIKEVEELHKLIEEFRQWEKL